MDIPAEQPADQAAVAAARRDVDVAATGHVRDQVRAVRNRHVPRDLSGFGEIDRVGGVVERRLRERILVGARVRAPQAQPRKRDLVLAAPRLERELVLACAQPALLDLELDRLPAGLELDVTRRLAPVALSRDALL